MADRSILFSGPMVRAILDGRKTQTRRVLKPQPIWSDGGAIYDAAGGQEDYIEPHWIAKPKHPYAVGAKLWVREAWTYINHGRERGLVICIGYNADGDSLPNRPSIIVPDSWGDRADCWAFRPRRHSSIHMPRWASRLTLLVTDVRVQRVQEISEEDAIAEGVPSDSDYAGSFAKEYCHRCGGCGVHDTLGQGYGVIEVDCAECETPQLRYRNLWNSINAKRPGCAWDDNPWVVAVTFRAINQNIDQIGDGDDH